MKCHAFHTFRTLTCLLFLLTISGLVPLTAWGQSDKHEPQGNILFMSTRDGNWEILRMNMKGEILKNLTFTKVMDYWASLSPDGKKVYFYSDRKGNQDISVMDADGKNQKTLVAHPATDRLPNISPDGKKIVFVSDRDHEDGELYVMQSDGSNVIRLTHNEVSEDVAFWSPDGRQIIFSKDAIPPQDTSGEMDFEIFIMNADGTGEIQLTRQPGFCSGAVFSPDGKKVAFYGKSDEGNMDLFTMKPNGKQVKNITRDAIEDYSPSWSPDGKWLAYTSGDPSNYDVWILSLKTGEKRRLTDHPKRDETPFWIKE